MPESVDRYLEYHNAESERRSANVGAYLVAQATIRLSAWVELFDSSGHAVDEPLPHAVAVFLHEYLHYLHNYSTLVGVEQAVATLTLAGIWAHTIDPGHTGRSLGHVALNEAHRALFVQTMVAHRHFVGEASSDIRPFIGATALRVEDWSEVTLPLAALKEASLDVTVVSGANEVRHQFFLAPHVIEEGLAYEFEAMFLAEHGTTPCSGPFYPYRVLGEVVRTYVPNASGADVYRAGLIAMNATNPGVQLMELVTQYPTHIERSGNALADDVGFGGVFAEAKTVLLRKLDRLQGMFSGRGLAEHGIASLFSRCRRLLERRLREPFFELQLSAGAMNLEETMRLVETFVPCEVIVEQHGRQDQAGRDVLIAFGNDDSEAVEGRRVLQAAVHATLTHLRSKDAQFVSSDGRKCACPYFTSCTHPTRSDRPEVCGSEPWLTLGSGTQTRCWYSQGVLALVAKSKAVGAPPVP